MCPVLAVRRSLPEENVASFGFANWSFTESSRFCQYPIVLKQMLRQDGSGMFLNSTLATYTCENWRYVKYLAPQRRKLIINIPLPSYLPMSLSVARQRKRSLSTTSWIYVWSDIQIHFETGCRRRHLCLCVKVAANVGKQQRSSSKDLQNRKRVKISAKWASTSTVLHDAERHARQHYSENIVIHKITVPNTPMETKLRSPSNCCPATPVITTLDLVAM